MNIIKKVTLRTKKYKIKKIYFLGILLYQYIKIIRYNKTQDKFKSYKFYSLKDFCSPHKHKRIFYLKVHRVHRTSIDCIRHWINIADKMNAFIYFVCDNPIMKEDIIKQISFPNKNFKFIKSDRKTLKTEIKTILNKVERQQMWERIAYSMLTPFIHAEKNNFAISYNIDADDILLCIGSERVCEALKKAEQKAKDEHLDLFNLDMFYSKSYGVHWSFGVVICMNPAKCLNILKENTKWRNNKKLIELYNICWLDKFNFNIDWFFTFIRDTKQLNMKTFYIDKALVAHMPDIILEHGWAFMLQWKNNNIHFPILSDFYKRDVWDTVPIPDECVKIDINLKEDAYKNFLCNFYDFGVSFEMDMLNYAKKRNLISKELYDKYAQTSQFIRENKCRNDFEKKTKESAK